MTAQTSSRQARILRRVRSVQTGAGGALFDIAALPATTLGAMPGWLTGEPFVDQGVEVDMPNLPRDIALPGLEEEPWQLLVSAYGDATLRLAFAPAGDPALTEPPSRLSIVTDDTLGGIDVVEGENEIEVRAADARVLITRYPFTVRVLDAEGTTVLRTADRMRQVAGFPMAPGVIVDDSGITLNLEIVAEESILGFGEQFGRLEKNGQSFVLHSDDALGTGTGLAYKPVPVWHSTAGYGALLNTGADVAVDAGHIRPSVLSLGIKDDVADLFVFVDEDPARRLKKYTGLTGSSIVPPVWAFGYWMGRCRYHSAEEMLIVSDGMTTYDVPCDVLHLDPDWLIVDRLNTDFIWNTDRFGNRAEFVADLAASGRRLSVWELPYVDPASPQYEHLEQSGYLVKTATGEVATLEGTPTPDGRPRALYDFTNPDARRWWQEQHRPFLNDGVAVFKTDFGEGFPSTGIAAADIPAAHQHNLYPLWYNAATSDAIAEITGRASLVWGRSGWAGSHRYPGQWGGDAESTVAGMQATLRGGLSYAICAPGFWSHDIGGFFGPELTPGLYVRWTQFGALSPLMRAHGLRPREPWEFGTQALEISRQWIRRRYELLPYLWNAAHDSVEGGLPMMRPLFLHYPEDPIAVSIDSQFLLGADLLVVPIFDDGDAPVSRRFYVPQGQWQDLYTGERYDGGRFHTRAVALDEMPVLVREGATIPTIDVPSGTRNVDDLLDQPWTINVYGGDARALRGFDGAPLPTDAYPIIDRTANEGNPS